MRYRSIRMEELTPGMRLVSDAGFPCIKEGEVREVRQCADGLYVDCAGGRHYLSGQDDDGVLVGFAREN